VASSSVPSMSHSTSTDWSAGGSFQKVLDVAESTLGTIVKIIALILPLSLDTFAVSVALGVSGASARQRMRTALLFSAFEATMPLIGIAIGRQLSNAIGSEAVYAAIGLLFLLAIYTLVAEEDEPASPFGRGPITSLTLALTISLDELAIGIAFGLLRVPLAPVIALIALQAFVLSQVGMRAGDRVSRRMREVAERLSGVVLVVVAIALAIAQFAT
jgi:putative Mn2+ efflux pump MntP